MFFLLVLCMQKLSDWTRELLKSPSYPGLRSHLHRNTSPVSGKERQENLVNADWYEK
jgi:hypothetical protein